MTPLPEAIILVLAFRATLFTASGAMRMLFWAMLTPGARTVAAALRAMGLRRSAFHQLPSRPQPGDLVTRRGSQLLLGLLLSLLVLRGALSGADDTVERRSGGDHG